MHYFSMLRDISALQVGVKILIIMTIGMVVMVMVYAVFYQMCKNWKKKKQNSNHLDNKDIV